MILRQSLGRPDFKGPARSVQRGAASGCGGESLAPELDYRLPCTNLEGKSILTAKATSGNPSESTTHAVCGLSRVAAP
jgi:hypothetical protein